MDTNRNSLRRLLWVITFTVVLFTAVWHIDITLRVLSTAFGMISFFVVGLCIAFILNVPLRGIETKVFAPLNKRGGRIWLAIRRPLSLVLTLLLALGLVALVIFMVIPEMTRTVMLLVDEVPGFLAAVEEWIHTTLPNGQTILDVLQLEAIDWNSLGNQIINMLKNGAGVFLKGTINVAGSVVSGAVNFVIGIILAIYVLAAKERLGAQARKALCAFLPASRAQYLLDTGATANQLFSAFIRGQFTESLILGVLCYIGMLIFGFSFAPMVSILVGVTAFIPMFGAFIGCFVGTFMILVNQGLLPAAWFVLFFVILQQVEGNLIYPHVVGKSVMLPGMWVLVAVTLGGNLAGIFGMLIGVPLAALLYVLFRNAVNRRTAEKEKLADMADS